MLIQNNPLRLSGFVAKKVKKENLQP